MDEQKFYLSTNYQEAKEIIREKLKSMSRTFIAAGFYLRLIRDTEGYKEDGYKDIWEFAEDQYGIKRSTTSRWMAMNEKFSDGGNSPFLAEEFSGFGKSQLQEMLYLDDKQIEEATPQMTVKEIRELREPERAEEEPVSILGYPLRVYPEGSLIATPGCGKQDCFDCHRFGCEIRQVDCYCVEAPMGNPFPCTTLNVVENLRQDIGNRCQFVNEDLAFHRAGDEQPVPCCKKCNNPCGYECNRSVQARHKVKNAQQKEMCDVAQNDKLAEEIQPESVYDEAWFVAEYAKRNEKELCKIMKIFREHKTNSDRAKEVQKQLAPYGYHGSGSNEFGFTMYGFSGGVEFRAENNKIRMKYGRFVKELEKLFDPFAKEFMREEQIPGQMNVGDFPELLPELDKPFGSRKQYIDTLTEYGAAQYFAELFRNQKGPSNRLFPKSWEDWFAEEVDDKGRAIEVVEEE